MTVNANLARIYGDSSVNLAPFGTTLPTTIDGALDAAFEDVGWINPDGMTESLGGSVEKKRGFQKQGVIRTRVNEGGTSWAFVALETKAQTNSLRYDEKAVTVTAGVRKAVRGPGQRISIRSAVIDFFDDDDDEVKARLIIPRFEIAPNGDKNINTDIASYPFIGEIIGDYTSFETDLEDA